MVMASLLIDYYKVLSLWRLLSDDYNYDYDTTKTLHAITRPRLRKAKAAVKNFLNLLL